MGVNYVCGLYRGLFCFEVYLTDVDSLTEGNNALHLEWVRAPKEDKQLYSEV